MVETDIREYGAFAHSTDVFGRVLATCRDQHFVVDGPAENGCPGEALNPGELFLAGIAACGVELLQVIARSRGIELTGVTTQVTGTVDRGNPVRSDLSVFNTVHVRFELDGVGDEDAATLVETFKGR
jgi:organic hydroperoxide reductase OsmC/OhrA